MTEFDFNRYIKQKSRANLETVSWDTNADYSVVFINARNDPSSLLIDSHFVHAQRDPQFSYTSSLPMVCTGISFRYNGKIIRAATILRTPHSGNMAEQIRKFIPEKIDRIFVMLENPELTSINQIDLDALEVCEEFMVQVQTSIIVSAVNSNKRQEIADLCLTYNPFVPNAGVLFLNRITLDDYIPTEEICDERMEIVRKDRETLLNFIAPQ